MNTMMAFIPIILNLLIIIGVILLVVKLVRKWIGAEFERRVDEEMTKRMKQKE